MFGYVCVCVCVTVITLDTVSFFQISHFSSCYFIDLFVIVNIASFRSERYIVMVGLESVCVCVCTFAAVIIVDTFYIGYVVAVWSKTFIIIYF